MHDFMHPFFFHASICLAHRIRGIHTNTNVALERLPASKSFTSMKYAIIIVMMNVVCIFQTAFNEHGGEN